MLAFAHQDASILPQKLCRSPAISTTVSSCCQFTGFCETEQTGSGCAVALRSRLSELTSSVSSTRAGESERASNFGCWPKIVLYGLVAIFGTAMPFNGTFVLVMKFCP